MKSIAISVCFLIVLATCEYQKGFDVVGPLTKTAFGCLVGQGYSYVNVHAASRDGVIDSTLIQTLTNAQAAGLQTAIYVVVCPSIDVRSFFRSIIATVEPPSLYTKTIWLKVQQSNPACSWQGLDSTQRCEVIKSIFRHTFNSESILGFFSTKEIWNKYFGNTCNMGRLPLVNLWYTDYQPNGTINPTESFSDFYAYGGFGGWTHPNIKTVAGSVRVTLCNNPAWHAIININWRSQP